MSTNLPFFRLAVSVGMVWFIMVAAGCTSDPTADTEPTVAVQETSSTTQPSADATAVQEEEHDEDAEHEEGSDQNEGEDHAEGEAHEESGEHERLPNEGAVIRIVSPSDGATFSQNEEIVVEIETENFVLGEDERHWELYVDGASWGSIEGGNQDEVVRGLEPGEHEITVYLSLGSHEQLEDGSKRHITVTE